MITRGLRLSLAILLVASFAATSVAQAASASSNADAVSMPPQYPVHWGPPPVIQTKDYVELPGGYGHGSGTLRHWIATKMAEDEAGPAPRSSAAETWPAKDLTGMTVDEARIMVLAANAELNVEILAHDAMYTEDYR